MITKKQVEQFFNENKDNISNKKIMVNKLYSFVESYLTYDELFDIGLKKEKEINKQKQLKKQEINFFLEQKENKDILKKWSKIIQAKNIKIPFAQHFVIDFDLHIEDREPCIYNCNVKLSDKIPEKFKNDFELIVGLFESNLDYFEDIIYEESGEYKKYETKLQKVKKEIENFAKDNNIDENYIWDKLKDIN